MCVQKKYVETLYYYEKKTLYGDKENNHGINIFAKINKKNSKRFMKIHVNFTILQNQMKIEAIWFHEKLSNFERNFH